MADLILKVSPEEVRVKSNQIDAQKQLMEALLSDMKSKVTTLADFWKSKSGENYVNKYQNVSKNCQGALNSLLKHVTNLSEAAAGYEGLEVQQQGSIEALSTQDIFA